MEVGNGLAALAGILRLRRSAPPLRITGRGDADAHSAQDDEKGRPRCSLLLEWRKRGDTSARSAQDDRRRGEMPALTTPRMAGEGRSSCSLLSRWRKKGRPERSLILDGGVGRRRWSSVRSIILGDRASNSTSV